MGEESCTGGVGKAFRPVPGLVVFGGGSQHLRGALWSLAAPGLGDGSRLYRWLIGCWMRGAEIILLVAVIPVRGRREEVRRRMSSLKSRRSKLMRLSPVSGFPVAAAECPEPLSKP